MYNHLKSILFLLFISSTLFAQHEALVPIQFNPGIKQHMQNHPDALQLRAQTPGDTLALPFVDDFSITGIYPDPERWSDNLVFVNTDLARNPPTYGVATFDGINAYGNAYNNASAAAQGSADTLTSRPINLFNKPQSAVLYTLADSIYLSFFYEKKGWGDAPENNDSLILEFYKPGTAQWSRQWFVKGGVTSGQDSIFTRVNISINDTLFLKNDFRFRFRSYGSLSGAVDLWHLDYVMLKTYGPGGFISDIHELSIINRNVSIIHPYSSMPWKYLKNNQSAYIINTLDDHYKNLSETETFYTNFSDKVLLEDLTPAFTDSAASDSVYPLTDSHRVIATISVLNNLTSPRADSAVFYSVHKLSKILSPQNYVAPDGIRSNDSVVSRYEFYNYYSYDDGTAEIGYDLVSAPGGKIALRFDLAQPDTLRAIRVLFVKQNLNVSNNLFTLKVWSSLSPETIIYQQANLKPVYTDSIDGMATFVIPALPVSGSIYVGIQQSGPDGFHVGFDRNTKSNSFMSYNVTGTWNQVAVADGSFMIRIVMGDSNLFVGISESLQNQSEIFIYPNPAADFIQCKAGSHSLLKNVSLFDATGRFILTKKVSEQFNIDVRELKSGLYLLYFYDSDQQISIARKILINH